MHLPPTARRRLAALGAATVLPALIVVVSAGPASAHDELVATVPVDGASVPAPSDVVLRFSEAVLPEFNQVVLTGPDGRDVAATVVVDGSTLTGRLPTDLGAGDYRVTWRASSSDGHPVSGRFGFTVVGVPAVAPTPATTPTAAPTTQPGSTSASAQAVVPAVAPTPAPSPADPGTPGVQAGSTSAQVLAVGAALALLTSLVLLWRRRQAQPRG